MIYTARNGKTYDISTDQIEHMINDYGIQPRVTYVDVRELVESGLEILGEFRRGVASPIQIDLLSGCRHDEKGNPHCFYTMTGEIYPYFRMIRDFPMVNTAGSGVFLYNILSQWYEIEVWSMDDCKWVLDEAPWAYGAMQIIGLKEGCEEYWGEL